MNIVEYILNNWTNLEKSTFNSEEVVIFKEIKNDDYGYGQHSYEGIGVDKLGGILWCYSSGCSCNGSCNTEHNKDIKILSVEGKDIDIDTFKPEEVQFSSLVVTFSDY